MRNLILFMIVFVAPLFVVAQENEETPDYIADASSAFKQGTDNCQRCAKEADNYTIVAGCLKTFNESLEQTEKLLRKHLKSKKADPKFTKEKIEAFLESNDKLMKATKAIIKKMDIKEYENKWLKQLQAHVALWNSIMKGDN